jgi:hypothetical protein
MCLAHTARDDWHTLAQPRVSERIICEHLPGIVLRIPPVTHTSVANHASCRTCRDLANSSFLGGVGRRRHCWAARRWTHVHVFFATCLCLSLLAGRCECRLVSTLETANVISWFQNLLSKLNLYSYTSTCSTPAPTDACTSNKFWRRRVETEGLHLRGDLGITGFQVMSSRYYNGCFNAGGITRMRCECANPFSKYKATRVLVLSPSSNRRDDPSDACTLQLFMW